MRVLILGGAVSGRAAAQLGTELGHRVTVFDRDPAVGADVVAAGIPAVCGEWSPQLLNGFDLVVASPGFSEKSRPIRNALEAGVALWSEIEFAARVVKCPIVAVTGTNGKTTVTSLIADMLATSGLSVVAAGNIGTAMSSVVSWGADALVVEASSFQLRFIDEFHPRVAVIINVAEDHLDWHGSYAAYKAAKFRVLENQDESDAVVFVEDDPGAREAATRARSRLIPVSGSGARGNAGGVTNGFLRVGEASVSLSDLHVSDQAYLADLAAAGAAALEMGAAADSVVKEWESFEPTDHRRRLVAVKGGVSYVDDSKATNVHAAIASVRSFRSVVLIAGGRNKGLDLSPLVQERNLKHLLALGEAAEEIVSAAGSLPAEQVSSMSEAVGRAALVSSAGDTVLLAPACASFDMFDSFAARGDAFASAVRSLEGR